MKHSILFIVLVASASGLAYRHQTGFARQSTPQGIPAVAAKRESAAESASQTAPLKLPLKNPRIVVLKSKRQLELYSDGALVRTYKVGLGLNPVPDKERQGTAPLQKATSTFSPEMTKALSTCRWELVIQTLKTPSAASAKV
jgi:hypothetical protein